MDPELCENFDMLIEQYPDELNNSEECDIHNIDGIEEYCPNGNSGNKCITELDKINAACLWLLNQNIANRIDDLSNEHVKAFIIYIMIWLNYMLNLKNAGKINNLNEFYTKHIENNTHYTNCESYGSDCNSTLNDKAGYNNFKEVIVKNMDFSNIKCTKYLGYANNIVDKFKELNENSSATGNTSYIQVWSTLSTDYENFKKKDNVVNCMNIPSIPPIKTTQHQIHSSGVTSSSLSIVNKIIIALSIFSAITIFLGIFYKCSLFVLRKRAQKQHLREKLKNIKKRMNH
ncbi:PIR protein [Plasmodium yoelii yoelii]|uniref:PIR protein n=2 Tax=Plasmodium yoelii yoelii TaxID=73239 RepID=A0AAF0B5M1_PLAYO|nr:PIR protein [Plasmodium yoelii yoelii]